MDFERSNKMQHIGGTLGVIASMIRKSVPLEGDYEKDGMHYCGKCNTPKQARVEFDFGQDEPVIIYPAVPCECEQAEFEKKEAEEKARKTAEKIARWKAEGLAMTAWQEASFEKDDQRDLNASTICRNFADRLDMAAAKGYNLMLIGEIGCGKSYLAACIANRVIESGKAVLMNNFSNLVAKMQADYGDNREAILERISDVPLLILDDLGVERETAYVLELAYAIINTRYISGKPLVVTTNQSIQSLAGEKNLDKKRIYDRVLEMCTPLTVKGRSRRLEIANAKNKQVLDWLSRDDDPLDTGDIHLGAGLLEED